MIHTDAAPKAIGSYSQAIRSGNTIYLSGQIPLDPKTNQLVSDDIQKEVAQVFENITAVCLAAGGRLEKIVKLTVFLTDINHLSIVNEVMSRYFKEPYPARTSIQVAALPKGARVEVEGILVV